MNWRTKLAVWLLKGAAIDAKYGETVFFFSDEAIDIEDLIANAFPHRIVPVHVRHNMSVGDEISYLHVPRVS